MKRSFSRHAFVVFAAAAALPLVCMAQTEPAKPAATDAKKLAFSSSDKLLVKNAGESYLGVTHLAEVSKGGGPGSESVKERSKKIADDFGDAWGELAEVSKDRGAELPKSDQTTAEKRDIADLKKAKPEKFDKLYLKALEKETKHAAAAFTNGAKSASDPDLKAYFAKWQPKVVAMSEETSKAEAEAGKKK